MHMSMHVRKSIKPRTPVILPVTSDLLDFGPPKNSDVILAFSVLQNLQIHMEFDLHLQTVPKLHLIESLNLAQRVITMILICKMTCSGVMRKMMETS